MIEFHTTDSNGYWQHILLPSMSKKDVNDLELINITSKMLNYRVYANIEYFKFLNGEKSVYVLYFQFHTLGTGVATLQVHLNNRNVVEVILIKAGDLAIKEHNLEESPLNIIEFKTLNEALTEMKNMLMVS